MIEIVQTAVTLTALQEAVEAERKRLCDRLCLPCAGTKWSSLLQGSQKLWLLKYRRMAKVQRAFNRGERAVLANMCQNPEKIPVCGVFCPTLLRGSKMFLICSEAEGEDKERFLLAEEHLQLMGVPVWPQFAWKGTSFPQLGCDLTAGAKRSLAGNAMHATVVGSLWAAALASVTLK